MHPTAQSMYANPHSSRTARSRKIVGMPISTRPIHDPMLPANKSPIVALARSRGHAPVSILVASSITGPEISMATGAESKMAVND